MGSISERKLNLAQEHEEMMKKLDIDNYTLSRIPKPDKIKAGVKKQFDEKDIIDK